MYKEIREELAKERAKPIEQRCNEAIGTCIWLVYLSNDKFKVFYNPDADKFYCHLDSANDNHLHVYSIDNVTEFKGDIHNEYQEVSDRFKSFIDSKIDQWEHEGGKKYLHNLKLKKDI